MPVARGDIEHAIEIANVAETDVSVRAERASGTGSCALISVSGAGCGMNRERDPACEQASQFSKHLSNHARERPQMPARVWRCG
jgi:hypothetical protein